MDLHDALLLFRRLGVNVEAMSPRDFAVSYFALAKRYHPDTGRTGTSDLMANINAARTTILTRYRQKGEA